MRATSGGRPACIEYIWREVSMTDRPLRLYGVLHLLALPGAPRPSPGLEAVCARALADAAVLSAAGFDGVVVENLGDAPFCAGRVSPHVGPMMTRVACAVRDRFPALEMGINVLRNDALTALGVAAASGAAFIRVNVLAGAAWTDQGLIQGEAHALLRARRELGLDAVVAIAADVLVKHAVPAGVADLATAAVETFGRGGADRLIVTGVSTGAPTALGDLDRVRAAVPAAPLWVGSGVRAETVTSLRGRCDAAIVGTSLHEEDDVRAPLCPRRAAALVAAARG